VLRFAVRAAGFRVREISFAVSVSFNEPDVVLVRRFLRGRIGIGPAKRDSHQSEAKRQALRPYFFLSTLLQRNVLKPSKFFGFSVFFSLQRLGEPFFIRASRET
jgi:hypothetical protein